MTDLEQKKIFSRNLLNCLNSNNKSQKEVADAIGVSPQTFNTWCQGIALPRMGKVQRLADYFEIEKSDLIEDRKITKESVALSDLEKEIILNFRKADEIDKAIVLRALKIEEKRLQEKRA